MAEETLRENKKSEVVSEKNLNVYCQPNEIQKQSLGGVLQKSCS